MQKVVNDQLSDWFERNPDEARDIVRKAIQAAAARVAARKARDRPAARACSSGGGMPGKLNDCQLDNPTSARSSSSRATPPAARPCRAATRETQAILPLRGKILNVEKARLDRALGNNEVQAMITAFGTGIGEDFDLDKPRYHKIVLMADADVDGQHITTLLLTLLFRYMRPLSSAATCTSRSRRCTGSSGRTRRTSTSTATGSATPCSPPAERRPASASRRRTASSATRVSAR